MRTIKMKPSIWDLDRNESSTNVLEYCKKFKNAANETSYKVGDKIQFFTGCNNHILASATIKGIDKTDIYIYSDAYWFPIHDDKERKIKLL